jgi:hypothetical protein
MSFSIQNPFFPINGHFSFFRQFSDILGKPENQATASTTCPIEPVDAQ